MKQLLGAIFLSAAVITTVSAQSSDVRKKQFNLDKSGLAIKGYDPVAYFTLGKPLDGKKDLTLDYQGATYRFATTADRDAFKANPGKYEPQYGGWCAYAMGSSGDKVEIDPETFKILDGKLYLFYNKLFNNTLKSWNKDEPHLKANADKNWMKFVPHEVFAPEGKAINGYDAVAFFTQSKPLMGADSLSCTYKDVRWLFATRADLDAFTANPEHYAPQYGGFCAFGTAQGHKAPTKPETWSIVNGKLYFNYNGKVKEAWTKDQQAMIEKADKTWPEIKDKP